MAFDRNNFTFLEPQLFLKCPLYFSVGGTPKKILVLALAPSPTEDLFFQFQVLISRNAIAEEPYKINLGTFFIILTRLVPSPSLRHSPPPPPAWQLGQLPPPLATPPIPPMKEDTKNLFSFYWKKHRFWLFWKEHRLQT